METKPRPLKIALHGMDSRAVKTMMQFLQEPCQGRAHIVINADDADLDIFDGDAIAFQKLLDQHKLKNSNKPILVFSINNIKLEACLCLKKPVNVSAMLSALDFTQATIDGFSKPSVEQQPASLPSLETQAHPAPSSSKNTPLPTYYDQPEASKTTKPQTTLRLNEKSLNSLMRGFDLIDANDPERLSCASYNPKNYYQGYFQAALEIAKSNKQIMLLESDWCPVTLFPRTQEIWVDAGDQELKGLAGIKLNRKIMSSDLFITRIDPNSVNFDGTLDKFQNIDSFLWKLAYWTSIGRFPEAIDYKHPVYLKNWPNFSRLMVTPHALSIAALLIQGPRTMENIAQILKIRPQYVFLFISAAHAIGLADQVKRAADSLVEVAYMPPNKNPGLLGNLISKLHSH